MAANQRQILWVMGVAALFVMMPLDITVPAFNLSLMALAKYLLPRAIDGLIVLNRFRANAEWPTADLAHPVG